MNHHDGHHGFDIVSYFVDGTPHSRATSQSVDPQATFKQHDARRRRVQRKIEPARQGAKSFEHVFTDSYARDMAWRESLGE